MAAPRNQILVIRGGAKYFETVRPAAPDVSPDEHAEWARGYAEQVLGNYRHVPVWIVGLVVPRHAFPDDQADWERVADLVSVGFAMENLFVAARARGLGTVPTVFHWYAEDDFRALLDIPAEFEIPVITPLGVEEEVGWEGCLSVPGLRGQVPRARRIRYSGFTPEGTPLSREVEGFHARVVQHECDHLIGKLYPMRVRDFTKFGYTDVLFPGISAVEDD